MSSRISGQRRKAAFCVLALVLSAGLVNIAGCHGSLGGVTINGLTASIKSGATVPLSATYADAQPGDKGISWEVKCAAADCGSFSVATTASCNEVYGPCTGAYQTIYTAPATPPPAGSLYAAGQVQINATSLSSSGRDYVITTITGTAAPPITVSLGSVPATLTVGASIPITATVKNDSTDSGVDWLNICGSPGACGSFSARNTGSGVPTTYTAPSTIPAGSTVTVIAQSNANAFVSASATITITTSSLAATTTTVTSSMNPSTFGQAVTFTATVTPAGPPTPTGSVT
ncbi:MAG: hypothetical protein ABSD20_20765, partial [Terriglobales bacterium]